MVRKFQTIVLYILCLELSGCGVFRAIGRGGIFTIEIGIILLIVGIVFGLWLLIFLGWLLTVIAGGVSAVIVPIFAEPKGDTSEKQHSEALIICCIGLFIIVSLIIGLLNQETQKASANSASHATSTVAIKVASGRSFSPMTWHASQEQVEKNTQIKFDFRQANGESRRPTVSVFCTAKGTGRFLAEQKTIHIPAGSQMPMMFDHPFEPHWNPSSTSRRVDIYCDAFGYQRFLKMRI